MEELSQSPEQETSVGGIIDKINKTNVTVYEQLNASNDKAAKAEFLENPNLTHPNNQYGNLDEQAVRKNLETLASIQQEIENSWMNDKEKRLVGMILEDSWKKNEFLAANLAYNKANTPEEKAEAAEWHRNANANLYGKPDEGTFYALLGEKFAKINPEKLSDEERSIYDRLVEKANLPKGTEGGRFKPKPETIERFSGLIKDFFGNFLKHIPEDRKEFSADEAARITNEIIEEELDVNEEDYEAIIDENASNASASGGIIRFPADAIYSRERLSALILHELGTHAMRAIPYQSQEIKSFATSFPGSETFDEGVAGCVEQALKGEYRDFGVEHYINIGLATFLGMNFREVYNFQMDLKKLTGEDTKKVLNNVQRCFRGTGELPNNKDLAYYNGAERVWRYIEERIGDKDYTGDAELFDSLFLSGKTDIQNAEQEALAYEMRTKGNLKSLQNHSGYYPPIGG